MLRRVLIIAAAGLAVAACAHDPELGGASGLTVLPGDTLPAPGRPDMAVVDRPAFLGPRDIVSIEVFGAPDLTQKEVEVDATGRVSFPLAGAVPAAGLTTSELAAAIADRLRGGYFRDPKVTVNLNKAQSQLITVEGEVKEPGIYPAMNRMTLMSAVASAKGTTENSALDDVVIFRTVGDKRYAALYNMKAIRNGAYQDPPIYANDVVMVGESRGRQLFRNLMTVLPVLTTPIILLLQNG